MRSKFLYRGEVLDIRDRRYPGRKGDTVTINGEKYVVTDMVEGGLKSGPTMFVSLKRKTPDEAELAIVRRVVSELRDRVRRRAEKSLNEPEMGRWTDVHGKKTERNRVYNEMLDLLDQLEFAYSSGS